jgi:hypothetical protein
MGNVWNQLKIQLSALRGNALTVAKLVIHKMYLFATAHMKFKTVVLLEISRPVT